MYRQLYQRMSAFFDTLDKILSPVCFLGIRLWVAQVFFKSGLVSLSDWKSNVALFEYEFKVPIVPPEVAAFASTSVELVCPVLLVLGFATRFGALGILATSLVIEFTYEHNLNHILWIFSTVLLVLKGGEKISLDYWMARTYRRSFTQ